MATYSEGEALVLARVRGVTGFTGTSSTAVNTSRGKWGLRNSGNSDHYAILKPGEFTREEGAMSMNISRYRTVIQVWQRYVDDGDSMTNLETHVENIKAYLDQYRKLGDTSGTIVEAFVTGASDVIQLNNRDGGIDWLRWDLYVDWESHDVITYAE